jgi:hypothetical protein
LADPQRRARAALPKYGTGSDIGMVADVDIAVARHSRRKCHEVANDAVMLNIRIEIRLEMRSDADVAGQGDER